MNIAIQWQDADSSSKAVTDHFPDAKIMICGGHAGRAHRKQLEKLKNMKHFTNDLISIVKNSHLWGMWPVTVPGTNKDAVACPNTSLKVLESTSL